MFRRHGFSMLRSARRGFTLIEIILVVVIILTLAAVVGPRLFGKAKSARIMTTKIQIANLKNSLGEFEVHAGRLPTTQEGLEALMKKPSDLTDDQWAGPYVDSMPKDGFNQSFDYKTPSEHEKDYDIISPGPDGKLGTSDDITNFDATPSAH
ncbi:MAG: type II secretion system major pseudopilin GspG [Candidatus Sumerlaeaceae bacterium]|nr:type II secretion system major pseudopilin GspG [Candidatus Sumerlaeaceae bacterium]